MANTNITLENLLELAQAATSIGDGDYIFIYKAGANGFSKIEKNVFFQGIAASANAGIDSEAREKIEAMWAKVNELIGDLANLAFKLSPTNALGELDWDSSAPVVPSDDPTLTLKSGGVTLKPTNDFTVGQHTGNGVSKTISVQGANLTENLTIAVTGSGFSVSTNSISASDANNGTTFTITFNGTTEGQTTGTLIVSSSEVSSGTITTKGSYIQQGGGDPVDPEEPTGDTVNITYKLLNFQQPSGTTIDSDFGYYNGSITKNAALSKTLTPISGATSNNDIKVFVGGVLIDSGYSYDSSTGAFSINANIASADVVVALSASTGTIKFTLSGNATKDIYISGKQNGSTITDQLLSNPTQVDGNNVYEMSGLTEITRITGNTGSGINHLKDTTSLLKVDLGGVKLTGSSYSQLFNGCTGLTEVKGVVVASSVSYVNSMFSGCSSLSVVTGLASWDVSGVTSLASVFDSCALTKLDISTWIKSDSVNPLTSMQRAFYSGTNVLQHLYVGALNTGGLSGSTSAYGTVQRNITIHCTTPTPPSLNATNKWIVANTPVVIKVPKNCKTTYMQDAVWQTIETYVSEES